MAVAGEVEEEGDAEGAADEGEVVDGAAAAEKGGVAGGHHVLEEAVVGEALL